MKSQTFTSKLWAGIMMLTIVFTMILSFGVNASRIYADDGNVSLDDLMNGNTTETTAQSSNNSGSNVIDDITSGLDHSKDDSGIAKEVGNQINYYAGIVIKILAYLITAGLTISKLLDIMYIAIPLTRKWLANGYMGNAGAAGTPGAMTPGMGGMMGPGMGGMMGPGMGGSRYGMGGMGGMGAMNGMNAMGGGMGPMADNRMAAQNQPATGRPQFVSNAALNAVATESVLGTDGRGQNAFKLYFKDMLVSVIVTGILIVLCITGVVAKLGFMLGNFIGDIIQGINL